MNKTRILAVIILLMCGVGFGVTSIFTGAPVSSLTGGVDDGNSKLVVPSDDLQYWYEWLSSSGRDGAMGALSEDNRRVLILSPGEYTLDYTVLMDTDYVDVLELIEDTVTITKSGNGLGFALLPDVDAVYLVADDRAFAGRYSRNSTAYDRDINEYEINENITPSVPSTGIISAATESTTEAVGSNPIIIQYQASGLSTPVLFGSFGVGIYSTTDGTSWTQRANSPVGVSSMWAADDIGNCVMSRSSDPSDIYYGTYDGTNITFTRAQLDGGDFSFHATGAVTNKFSFKRLKSGTLLLTEYSTGTNGRYIYRSTDLGHNWTEVYDAGDGVIEHFHGTGQVVSTGRIVTITGDAAKSKAIYSDDDGLTWSDLYALGTHYTQPVHLMDIGHSEKLLCADDSNVSLFLLDVNTGEVTPLFFDTELITGVGFVWYSLMHEGIIYAGSLDSSGSGQQPVVYTSTNLVDWNIIYRIEIADAFSVPYLEHFNGALHGDVGLDVSPSHMHLKLTPPAVGSKTGVLAECAVTNGLNDAGRSSYEDGNYLTYVEATDSTSITQVDETDSGVANIPNGTKAVRVIRDDATSQGMYITKLASGQNYGGVVTDLNEVLSGTITIGNPSTNIQSVTIQPKYSVKNGAFAQNNSAVGLPYDISIEPGEWRTIDLPPIRVDAGDIFDSVYQIGVYLTAKVITGTVDVLIGNAQITGNGEQPSTWQLGGTPRASAVYDLNWNTPEKATHLFNFKTLAKSSEFDYYGNRQWYIRSWRVSATVYAQLYYDGNDQKFKLDVEDGVNSNTLETAALWFKKGQSIVFAIQFGDEDDAKVHLSVGHGRTIETVDSTNDYTAFGLADILVRWADKDAANGLNGYIYDTDMTGVLTTADIVSYLDGKI